MAEPIRNGKGRRTLYQKVAVEGQERPKHEESGSEDFEYVVEIDWEAVGKLALRAADNKGGTATDGPLTVKITGRKTNALLPKVNVRDTNDNYITTVDITDELLSLIARDNIQNLDREAVIKCLDSGQIVQTKTASYRKAH